MGRLRENGGKRREPHFTAEMERENMGEKEKEKEATKC